MTEPRQLQHRTEVGWVDRVGSSTAESDAIRVLLDATNDVSVNGIAYRYKPEPEPTLLCKDSHNNTWRADIGGAPDWRQAMATLTQFAGRSIPVTYDGIEYRWGVPDE